MSEELQKQAQAKLSEARKLIREAGELAKEGQFSLHFGEIGDFIPRSAVDKTILREKAIENLQRDGRYNGCDWVADGGKDQYGNSTGDYFDRPRTAWIDMSEDEREAAIEDEIGGLQEAMEVPYEFREYGYDASDADCWWHPSRC